ncbi:MAG: hypothetical protein HY706_07170 [Candidatus Hydrogenedentes bacterium]|nr:hypothetical protein [Candidatus Hydrogenedentota bacterium]
MKPKLKPFTKHSPPMAVTLLLLVLHAAILRAQEIPTVVNSGAFRTLTIGVSDGYLVSHLLMSADGSHVAYTTHPSLQNFINDLRVRNTDGSNEQVIFTNDPIAVPRLFENFDISDDGSVVVYAVNTELGFRGELWVFDTSTGVASLLLRDVPHSSFGIESQKQIEVQPGLGLFALSGDGTSLYFLNRFGPQGSNSDGIPPSGFTVYRVSVPGGQAEPVFETADLASVPGISPSAVELIAAGGQIASDFTGSVVMIPVGGASASANPPVHVLRVVSGTAGAEIVLNLAGSRFTGPSLSGDGTMMAVARFGGDLEPEGLFIMNADGTGTPLVLDRGIFEFGRWPTNPALSKSGNAVAHRMSTPGGPSVRWAPTNTVAPRPISQNGVFAADREVTISQDGSRVAFIGGVADDVNFGATQVVIFDWTGPAKVNASNISSVTVSPSVELVRQDLISPVIRTTFSFGVNGLDAAGIRTFVYNSRGISEPGVSGLGFVFSLLRDDGQGGDQTAGDGQIDDTDIWANASVVDDVLTGRGMVIGNNGTAGFVDFNLSVRDPIAPVASFLVDPASGAAPLTVTFTNTSTGDFHISRWDFNNDGNFDATNPVAPITFQYTEVGQHSVRLQVEGLGGQDEVTRSAVITVHRSEDIDGSGGIDAVDVQTTINAALGLDVGGLDADVDDNGDVDAVDVQRVINAALGL